MTNTPDDPQAQTAPELALDRALARLPRTDLTPLAARSQLMAARRRLSLGARPASLVERCEPALLAACAACHLVWAVLYLVEAGARHFG